MMTTSLRILILLSIFWIGGSSAREAELLSIHIERCPTYIYHPSDQIQFNGTETGIISFFVLGYGPFELTVRANSEEFGLIAGTQVFRGNENGAYISRQFEVLRLFSSSSITVVITGKYIEPTIYTLQVSSSTPLRKPGSPSCNGPDPDVPPTTIPTPTTECTTPEVSTTESTTPEVTSTESTTPEDTTTECTTTEDSTIGSSTSEVTSTESTTPEATTIESTTPDDRRTRSTTPDVRRTRSTTPEASTTEITTTGANITESTTTEASTSESTTTEDITTESTTTGANITDSTTAETSTSDSTTTEGSTTESITPEGSTTESTTTGANITESTTAEASTTESTTTEGSTTESITPEGSTTESTTTGANITESTTAEASTTESTTTEGSTTESTTTGANITESTTAGANITESTTAEASTSESTTTGASTTESATTEASTTDSTTETTTESTTESTTEAGTTESTTTKEPYKPTPQEIEDVDAIAFNTTQSENINGVFQNIHPSNSTQVPVRNNISLIAVGTGEYGIPKPDILSIKSIVMNRLSLNSRTKYTSNSTCYYLTVRHIEDGQNIIYISGRGQHKKVYLKSIYENFGRELIVNDGYVAFNYHLDPSNTNSFDRFLVIVQNELADEAIYYMVIRKTPRSGSELD